MYTHFKLHDKPKMQNYTKDAHKSRTKNIVYMTHVL